MIASPKTFVLVHGAGSGGYAWQEVERLLEANGSKVFTVQLPGHESAGRGLVTDLMQATLGELLELERDGKQAQWNLHGPLFIPVRTSLHEWVDQYRHYFDLVAERIPHVGNAADGRTGPRTDKQSKCWPCSPSAFIPWLCDYASASVGSAAWTRCHPTSCMS